jgi:hypothetical protein
VATECILSIAEENFIQYLAAGTTSILEYVLSLVATTLSFDE